MWNYTKKVMDHFFHPKNMGVLEHPTAVGQVGSIACGDALKLYLVIENDKIVDAHFQTFGCGSAIASSSVLTEMIKGRTVEEALTITNEEIAAELGGLPPEKMHCSVMGREALEAAIANYRGETVQHDDEDEGRLVCRCFAIHENRLRRHIIENKLRTVSDVTNYTKAGGGCTSCHADIQDIIDDVWNNELASLKEKEANEPKVPEKKASLLTNIQKIAKIQQVLEDEIKPGLIVDGGSIELIDVENNVVKVKLHGACSTCPSGQQTLKGFVERILRERVLKDLIVVEVR